MSIGRNPNEYQSRIGVFDWMIGHQCQGWDFTRLWTHDWVGMSLRGFIQTSSVGFLLFCFGYGIEYLFAGFGMGFVYNLSFLIPSTAQNFERGIPIAELIWGFWSWYVLLMSIAHYRKNPQFTPWAIKSKLYLIPAIVLLILSDIVFIGSSISYGFVQQPDMVNQRQTLFAMCGSTGIYLLLQFCYLILPKLKKKCSEEEETGNRYVSLDSNSISMQIQEGERHNSFIYIFEKKEEDSITPTLIHIWIIRILCLLNFVFVFGLTIYVVIFDGIMRPCAINWNSNST